MIEMTVRVLIVDDQEPFRMAARMVVEATDGFEVVGEAETFAGDLDFLVNQGVSVTLLDDERCRAVMREFQDRYPAVWSEDIGGR